MTLVVDASVAVKCFVEEPGSSSARALLAGDDSLVAPALVVVEATSAAWKKERLREIGLEQARAIVGAVPMMFDRLYDCIPLSARALEIAADLDHPVYDCYYLALAETEDVTLVTDDARLLRRIEGTIWERRVRALR